MAGVPPVHLIIEKADTMFAIQQEGAPFTWEETEFRGEQIATKFDSWEHHPSELSIAFDNGSEPTEGLKIFTDGSASEEGVGAAFVVFDETGRKVHSLQMKLPNYSNNFEAEGVAILKAMDYIYTQKEGLQVQILTDSLSTLRGMANYENRNTLVNQIKSRYRSICGKFQMQFSYVKAHSGIGGNELADELAKEAITTGKKLNIPITKRFINEQLTKNIFEKWNSIWTTEGKDSELYQWIRNVKHRPDHFPSDRRTSQALTGHGRFPFYLYRFGIRENNKCQCGLPAENMDHFLKDCPLTEEFRAKLKKKHHGRIIEAKPEIVKSKASLAILGEMVDHINLKAL